MFVRMHFRELFNDHVSVDYVFVALVEYDVLDY